MLYQTKILDLSVFGIFDISRAILTADADSDITYRVSFNGGKSFQSVNINEIFLPNNSNGKIVLEIKFPKTNSVRDLYRLNVSGVFPLTIGTTVYFTDGSNTFSAVIGHNGRYNISLPSAIYKVYYIQAGKKIILTDDFSPESYVYRQQDDLDKENTIELFLSSIDWATNAVYDTFKDSSKTSEASTATIDLMQNLTDGSGRVVRYWALIFEQ